MKECVTDLNSACSPYLYSLAGLRKIEDQRRKVILEKEFLECAEKLRGMICEEIGFPPDTSWFNILDKAGYIAPVLKEDADDHMKKGFAWASSIKLSEEAGRLCNELEDIRFSITGRL